MNTYFSIFPSCFTANARPSSTEYEKRRAAHLFGSAVGVRAATSLSPLREAARAGTGRVRETLINPLLGRRGGRFTDFAHGPKIERLPAYFINREGDVEPSLPSMRAVHEDADTRPFSEVEPVLMPKELSEAEAFNRLACAVADEGQLMVRTADGLMTAWFAGIGDPHNLFVELRPRDVWVDRYELVMGAMCSLADAERLLRSLYRGVGSDELSATERHTWVRRAAQKRHSSEKSTTARDSRARSRRIAS